MLTLAEQYWLNELRIALLEAKLDGPTHVGRLDQRIRALETQRRISATSSDPVWNIFTAELVALPWAEYIVRDRRAAEEAALAHARTMAAWNADQRSKRTLSASERKGTLAAIRLNQDPVRPPRVVIAYTKLHPKADEALRLFAPHAERRDVSADEEAYWRLLSELWVDQEDFILVEHDVEVSAELLEAFGTCPEPWCSALGALQCNRWRHPVMEAYPDLFNDIPADRRIWHSGNLDGQFLAKLEPWLQKHVHEEPATHHHRCPSIRRGDWEYEDDE